MATQSSGTTSSFGFATIYGGISTVDYTTTITASGLYSQSSITVLFWPTPSTTEPIEYTTVAIPTNPASKYSPDLLLLFIATYVDVVVVNTAGQPITTLIEVQAQPAYVYGAPAAGGMGTSCIGNSYTCWSAGKRACVIIAIILGGLFFLVFIIWFCCIMRISGPRIPDEEEAYGLKRRDRGHGAHASGVSRHRRLTRSDPDRPRRQGRKTTKKRHCSLSSGSCTEPPKPLHGLAMAVQDYREVRRTAGVPQRILGSETSSGSTGRRAVLGVGARDTGKDTMCFDETASTDLTRERNAARDSTTATIPKTEPRARPTPGAQHENSRQSRKKRFTGHQERGRSLVRRNSLRRPPPRLQSCSPYRRSHSPPTDNHTSFVPSVPVAVAVPADPWETIDQRSPKISQRSFPVHSSKPIVRNHRRRLREERRIGRHHHVSSQLGQPRRSRGPLEEVNMSERRGEIPACSCPPIPRKSSRRRLSN